MFRLQTFGPIDLRNPAGQSVQSVLSQPRRTALLIYLAAATPRGYHRRDTLLALLWPESDAERGRAALSQAVYFLRRSLSELVVVSRGSEELALSDEHLECDAARFHEALRKGRREEALSLYLGDFLEGFHVSDAPEFERWVEAERERLRGMAVQAAWQLAEEAEGAADQDGAVSWARVARGLAPLEEASLRRLLGVLGRSGRRGEAAREYQAFAARLREEYGLEPAAETRALLDAAGEGTAVSPSADRRQGQSPRSGPEWMEAGGAAAGPAAANPAPQSDGHRRAALLLPARLKWVLGGALGAVALAATLAFPGRPERGLLSESRVLVPSFENRTGDPSLDVLGEMTADWITQGLQQTEMVQVVDPASALLFSRGVSNDTLVPTDMARVAALSERAGAGVIVAGAIYKQGDSLRFRTELIEARSGTVLRTLEPVAAPVDQPVQGVEQLRTRVAGTVASMLDRRVASLSTRHGRAPTFEAYREYILGLEPFQQRRYMEAAPHFLAAARLDTTFVLPLFWAAFAYDHSGDQVRRDSIIQTIVPRRDRLAPLDRHALDYFLAQARQDVAGAFAATRLAADLSPGSNWSFLAGEFALKMGRPEEALRYLQQVDPERGWARSWGPYWHALAAALHALERYEEELEWARRRRRIDPESANPRGMERKALVALGRLTEARLVTEEAMRLPVENVCPGDLLRGLAQELRAHGYLREARETFEAAIAWYRSPAAEAWINAQRDPEASRRGQPFLISMVLAGAERWSEAEAAYQIMLRDSVSPYLVSFATAGMGRLAARRGDRAAAERRMQDLEQMKEIKSARLAQAGIACLLGDTSRALNLLEQAVIEGRFHPELLHLSRDCDPLRRLPRFQALVRPLGGPSR